MKRFILLYSALMKLKINLRAVFGFLCIGSLDGVCGQHLHVKQAQLKSRFHRRSVYIIFKGAF